MAGVGRPHNELALLQLQRQHERQEDKARLRVQQGLLSGPDSQRQRGFPQTEQTQFRPEASDARRELPGAARPGGLGATVLTSLLQRHHSSVSTYLSTYLPTFIFIPQTLVALFANASTYVRKINAVGKPIRRIYARSRATVLIKVNVSIIRREYYCTKLQHNFSPGID